MTEKEFNEEQEKIQKKLEAIQKMQNYLGDALKRLQSLDEEHECSGCRSYPEIENTIRILANQTHRWIELAMVYSKQKVNIDKDDSKRQD